MKWPEARTEIILEELRILLQPWYLQIKFVHLFMVGIWSFSTAVAYRNYLLPAFLKWQASPQDEQRVADRDKAMERFDRGVIVEHIAFPLAILSGLLMVWVAGWNWHSVNWLTVKLAVVLLIFVPVEALDYHLSHFGGNKRTIRLAGDEERYESAIRSHWQFLRITTPVVLVFIPLIFYLAVTKPI